MPSLSTVALDSTNWLLNRLSVERVSALGSVIGRRLLARAKRNARARANIALALPDLPKAEREAILERMWDNFGRTIAETFAIEKLASDPARVSLANPELLDDCGRDGRGTVFIGLHYGNWELMAVPLPRHGIEPMCVYRPLKNESVNAWVDKHRAHLCPGGLYALSRATVLRLVRHVRTGGAICIAGDHRDSNGLSVPFFGRPAPSVALPAMLAVRYQARLFTVRVDRLPDARFSVFLERIEVSDTGNAEADTLATTATIQAGLEKWVRADPGRWLWFYKRWGEVDEVQQAKRAEPDLVEQG